MEKSMEKFFLGANSCEGFVSEFASNYDVDLGWKAYIIKGGPGTGKSSFMKYLAVQAQDAGHKVQLGLCSSDTFSLDGIIISDLKTLFLDGTAPHVVEPQFPGVCEQTVNLGAFWDQNRLGAVRKEVVAVTRKNKALHKMASRYMLACGQLMVDNLKLAEACTDNLKTAEYAISLCNRYLPEKRDQKGHEWVRFIEGITPLGVVCYWDTVTEFYKNRVIISDENGSVSNIIMNCIRKYALEAGYEIITLKNPFLPGELCDHILIPELSLAFVTENTYVHFNTPERRIHARRFMNVAALHKSRERMRFNKKAIRELLLSSAATLAEAKSVHDELEKYYIAAMDFNGVTALAEELAEQLFGNTATARAKTE